jgi:Dehydrogenases (flavoproteins)
MYDIAIVGLGPAGATLARLLDKKYKVIAINYSKTGGKCCGGLLSPDAQKSLAKFDITVPRNVLVDPQIFSVRTIDFDNNMEEYYQRFYVNMSRENFDKYLISLIPKNVKLEFGLCTHIIKQDDYYELNVRDNDNLKKVKARIIIGADGANSIVRNTLYKRNRIKRYVAIQEIYKETNSLPFYSCIFDSTITDSYAWTISKDNKFIIGGAFPVENCNERFSKLVEKCKKKGMKFGKKIRREGCYVYITTSLTNIVTGSDNAYLLGEAAGFISPSSLEGISYAINSATILAECINNNSNIAHAYFRKSLNLRIKILLKILKKPFMYNKFLRKIVMKSKIGSISKHR